MRVIGYRPLFPSFADRRNSFMHMHSLNWLAILVAGLSTMVVGFLWYSPLLFAKSWMREMGSDPNDMARIRGHRAIHGRAVREAKHEALRHQHRLPTRLLPRDGCDPDALAVAGGYILFSYRNPLIIGRKR